MLRVSWGGHSATKRVISKSFERFLKPHFESTRAIYQDALLGRMPYTLSLRNRCLHLNSHI